MIVTREELEAQRKTLVAAIRSGALSVQHGDKRVQYRSMAELREALAGIDDELATVSGKRRNRIVYLGTGRGI